jgi:hypothetical protein
MPDISPSPLPQTSTVITESGQNGTQYVPNEPESIAPEYADCDDSSPASDGRRKSADRGYPQATIPGLEAGFFGRANLARTVHAGTRDCAEIESSSSQRERRAASSSGKWSNACAGRHAPRRTIHSADSDIERPSMRTGTMRADCTLCRIGSS